MNERFQYDSTYKIQSTFIKMGINMIHPMFKCFRDFCLDTSIHGFNHIALPGRHWMERVMWMMVTAAAIWGATEVSLGQWQRYQDNPTVITLEKDFRTWQFSLPAVTVCDVNRANPAKISSAILSRWNVTPDDEKYTYYEKFVLTVVNSDLFNLKKYEDFKDDASLDVDLYNLTVEMMPDLQVKATSSNGKAVHWFPVITESGACFATNSLAINDVVLNPLSGNETGSFPLRCKYSALSCYVILEIVVNATFYVHSPYDVVDITSPGYLVFPSLNRVTELSVMETGTGKGVRDLKPQRRGCLYTEEPNEKGLKVYSTNSCRLSCRNQLAIRMCGCKPFYYSYYDGPLCSPSGMHCLSQYAHVLITNAGEKCSCNPQCVDATFKELSNKEEIWSKGPFAMRGAIRYTVQAPRTRYTREIVFHFQDLVVSFGGAAGLFLGASFISFVEILYFIIERCFRLYTKQNHSNTKNQVKTVQPSLSYEKARIFELSAILESQQRFDYFK